MDSDDSCQITTNPVQTTAVITRFIEVVILAIWLYRLLLGYSRNGDLHRTSDDCVNLTIAKEIVKLGSVQHTLLLPRHAVQHFYKSYAPCYPPLRVIAWFVMHVPWQ
jgi:hypothetical protein